MPRRATRARNTPQEALISLGLTSVYARLVFLSECLRPSSSGAPPLASPTVPTIGIMVERIDSLQHIKETISA